MKGAQMGEPPPSDAIRGRTITRMINPKSKVVREGMAKILRRANDASLLDVE
jgi:hypothetical protein